MLLSQTNSMQGYILSGVFALIGVALGSVLTFLQQNYIREKQKKDIREKDAMDARKALYIEIMRVIKSSVFAEANENLSDKNQVVEDVSEFLEAERNFINENSMYMQLYASKEVMHLFMTCASLTSDYLHEILKEDLDEEKVRTLRMAIRLARNDIIRLIKNEIGLSD